MRKIILAFFVAILMLLIPVATNAVTVDIENKNYTISDEEEPKIFITPEERDTLELFIEDNFDEEEKTEAYGILNDVLSYDSEYELYLVDVDPLVQVIEQYSYFKIIDEEDIQNVQNHDELYNLIDTYWSYSDYPFANLINAIVDVIKDRLGWIYDIFNEGKNLFLEGVDLAKQFIKNIQNLNLAIGFTLVINLLVSIPILYFSNLLQTLFNLDFQGFIDTITQFTEAFTTELGNLIDWAEALIELLGETFEPLLTFVQDVGDFVDELTSSNPPWERDIIIKGKATTLLGEPIIGAEISCRGETTTTGSDGSYEFTVSPDDTSEDSIPPNNWYGLHNCSITITDGEKVKQTPKFLSYVASDGTMEWPFIIIRGRSVVRNLLTMIQEIFEIFAQRLQILFPFLFKNLNQLSL
jgi:hypothetical protein